MKDGLRRCASIAALALAVGVAGCNSCSASSGGTPDASGHASPTSLTKEQAAQPLARVGDKTITLGDFAAALEHMDQFDRLRYESPERRKELLDEMITVELLAQEATAKGYDKDPLSQQELRAILRDAMLAEARKSAPKPEDVSETDVRAYYTAHRADYADPERRRVSVIVLRDDATAADALAAAKKSPGPAEWGEIVRAKSVDPSARANVPVDLAGDLGMVSPPGDARGANPRVPEEVRAAAFSIKDVGGVYDKVVSAGGKRYVVRLTQKLAPHDRSLAEAERSIRVKLSQDALRAKENDLIQELRKTVKVEVDEAALATVKTPNLPSSVDAGTK